ncbi:MAG: DNA mismatch repair protein MutS [Bacteroidales bacterium]|nr:DNA mismatch repair protein MutS [Candidatus Latescibacterota bacterium]
MSPKATPLMTQYQEIRDRYDDGILLFQVGDFYETFYEDARKISRILNIALTSRDKKNPIPLAGVPIHAVDAYISKLLAHGEKVIICDQVELPGEGKGIVKREVTDIITPGTTLEPSTLQEKENNYIMSIVSKGENYGFSLIDLSTGEFRVAEDSKQIVENLISGFQVRESIIPEGEDLLSTLILENSPGCSVESAPGYLFNEKEAEEELKKHFGVNNLSCFGIEGRKLAVISAGSLLRHIKDLRNNDMAHLSNILLIVPEDTLFLDAETARNLELTEPVRGDSPETTLIHHMDRTKTSGGGRCLRSWMMHPSRIIEVINRRLEGISSIISDQIMMRSLRSSLVGFPDIERIISRVTTGRASPRELLYLADALSRIPEIIEKCSSFDAKVVRENIDIASQPNNISDLIKDSIDPEAPSRMKDGGFIRTGFDSALDILIDDSENGRQWIADLQRQERERTGIPSLKVGFNKVFGYYIEVSRIHESKIPEDYSAKQSLVASQRYVTEKLKERETQILTADVRRIELEKEIFSRVCSEISARSHILQKVAQAVSILDVLSSLADLAIDRNFCMPVVDDSEDLVVSAGRHPVVEAISGKSFIPNEINIRPDERQLLLITGPNMGGKSTYIRQAALIAIMAQMGSFVPASRARIGIMDRIFTRVGSSDNLARGQSTFLVEMGETARILNNCSSKSLVLLDEIGRGTSTIDGLSIAWAVTEYLLENKSRRPRTLFATHFHELTSLSDKYPRLKNMRVEVKEWGDNVIFLYRILEGKSDKSYGIHVAQLAGLPDSIIKSAWQRFKELEANHVTSSVNDNYRHVQASLFKEPDPIREILKGIDPDRITPLDALQLLAKLHRISKDN